MPTWETRFYSIRNAAPLAFFIGGIMIEDLKLTEETYVVFDLETTGLYPNSGDSIIEIGAVKIKNGEIIEKYDELINPNRPLPQKIVEVTNITDEMLKDKDNEENAVKRFIEWFGDLPMVAHNAKFCMECGTQL